MQKGKPLSKAVSALMSLILAVGLMPLPAYAGEGALAVADTPVGATGSDGDWMAYGVFGGQYAYLVDLASKMGEYSGEFEYDSKIVKADGTVVFDLPVGGALKETFPQVDMESGSGTGLIDDLEGGCISLRSAETGLWGVWRLDGAELIPTEYDGITPAGRGLAQFACSWHGSSNAGIDYFDGEGAKIASVGRSYDGKEIAYTYLLYGSDSYLYDTLFVTFAGGGIDRIVVEKQGGSIVERADLDEAPERSYDPTDPEDFEAAYYADAWWNNQSHALADGTVVSYLHEVIPGDQASGRIPVGKVSVVGEDGRPVVVGGYTLGVFDCFQGPDAGWGPGAVQYVDMMNAMHNSVKHGNADVWWATDAGGKWGAVDSYGNVVVPFDCEAYADRGLDGTDYALVKKGGEWSFLNVAAAGSDAIASGTWGTCPWEISADGTLTVHPGIGGSANKVLVPEVGYYGSYWDEYKDSIVKVVFAEEDGRKAVAPADLGWMFSNFAKTESFDLSGLDTSGATDMNRMFIGCSKLASLDLGSFDTAGVTNMNLMFQRCNALTSVNLSSFDTSNLVQCQQMFESCPSLLSLDLSSFDTSNVKQTSSMFAYCTSLATVYASDLWSMESVLNTEHTRAGNSMFLSCVSLVGENGTTYDISRCDETYARIDAEGAPGYLTWKAAPARAPKPMHRLYNRWSGEHLFTGSSAEVASLEAAGWKGEGVAWLNPASSDIPVYRLYNQWNGDHHYTVDRGEYDQLGAAGWTREGIAWRAAAEADEGAIPLYRLYNRWAEAGSHLWTTDRGEYDGLPEYGWQQEGVAWYAFPAAG